MQGITGYTLEGAISISRFGELLKQAQGLQFDRSSKEYAMLHESLIAASTATQGALVRAKEIPEAKALLDQLQLSNAFC